MIESPARSLTAALEVIRAAAIATWREHGAALVAEDEDDYFQSTVACFDRLLDRAYRVGWDVVAEKVVLADLDRAQPMMNGPMFTSVRHPWPRDRLGMVMVPIVQLDLTDLSALSGRELGTGLAQLWQAGSNVEARLIPAQDVLAQCDDVPPLIGGSTIRQMDVDLGNHGLPSFLSNAYRIIGYDGPYLFGPVRYDEHLNQFIASRHCAPDLAAALQALKSAVLEGRTRYCQLTRVLGSFDPINYDPEDMPPALFCTDDDVTFNTGDCGTLAMYAEIVDDALQLTATFDCY